MSDGFWEKYKHPKWQEKRLRILERDGFKCRRCYEKDEQLHVHHGHYERGKNPWEYDDATLFSVCEKCHKELGAAKAKVNKEVALLGVEEGDLEELARLIEAIRNFKEFDPVEDDWGWTVGRLFSRLSNIVGYDDDFYRVFLEFLRDEGWIDGDIAIGAGVSA